MKKLFAIVAVMGVLRYCIFHEFGCYRIGYWFGFLY